MVDLMVDSKADSTADLLDYNLVYLSADSLVLATAAQLDFSWADQMAG
jgi:hypothetical protein